MEITDEIKQTEILGNEEQEDLFYTLLSGKTIKEEIETSRGKFIVKFPKQKDLMYIDRRIAAMRGGFPAESFDANANFTMQKIAFLDVVVESGEQWFNNLKNKNNSFSWGEVPDVDFIDEIYVKAWAFRTKVQNQLKRTERKTDSGTSNGKDISEDVGNGLFSGVAGTTKRD